MRTWKVRAAQLRAGDVIVTTNSNGFNLQETVLKVGMTPDKLITIEVIDQFEKRRRLSNLTPDRRFDVVMGEI